MLSPQLPSPQKKVPLMSTVPATSTVPSVPDATRFITALLPSSPAGLVMAPSMESGPTSPFLVLS